MSDPIPDSVATAWERQRQWSAGADREKKSITSWRLTTLLLGILGAALETGAAQAKSFDFPREISTTLALSGALALAAVSVIIPWKLGKDSERRWIRARSIAEEFKSEIYQYLAGTGVYRGANPDGQLAARTAKAQRQDEALAAEITTATPEPKDLPSIGGIDDYIEKRVTNQVLGYYKVAAKREADAAQRFRSYQFYLALLAALLGVVAGVMDSQGISLWVAVVTTIAGAVATHSAAGRHEYLSISYTSTASHLEDLRNEFASKPAAEQQSDDAIDEFVRCCESTISVQNQAWMGKVPRGAPEES